VSCFGRLGRAGVALPLALLALVLIGALVGTAFVVGRQELAVGRSAIRLQQASAAAEAGVQLRAALWRSTGAWRLAVGDSQVFGGGLPGTGWYHGSVRRLSDLLYLVRAEGFSQDSTARQHVGTVLRARPLELAATAAAMTWGDVTVGAASWVDGTDHVPVGWDGCPPSAGAVAGIRLSPVASLDTAACGGSGCVLGNPGVVRDSLTTGARLLRFGDLAFPDLRRFATVVLPGGDVTVGPTEAGARCQIEASGNWGSPLDPDAPCGDHFPLVWSDGDLRLTGAQGQGVVAVSGDLDLGPGVGFFGAIIATGAVRIVGPDTYVRGAVIAGSVDVGDASGLGEAGVRYSACALVRALRFTASVAPLRSRGWARLH
jgi:hypothetical protein